jgi:hypothetical protein
MLRRRRRRIQWSLLLPGKGQWRLLLKCRVKSSDSAGWLQQLFLCSMKSLVITSQKSSGTSAFSVYDTTIKASSKTSSRTLIIGGSRSLQQQATEKRHCKKAPPQ